MFDNKVPKANWQGYQKQTWDKNTFPEAIMSFYLASTSLWAVLSWLVFDELVPERFTS